MTARKEQNWAAQGRRFEHEVIHNLSGSPDGAHEGYGFDCIRSAASKGKVDIVAVGAMPLKPGEIAQLLFIQCKRSDPQIGPSARIELMAMALRARAVPLVAHRVDGAVWYREITGPGPKDWRYWFPVWCSCGDDDCNIRLHQERNGS